MKDNESALPRFTKLDVFNPHRASFECKHEAAVNPPIAPEAEALFQEAQALSSFEIWPEKREYKKIAALYEQAMKLGHWKAQFNLAGAYLQGAGVPQDIEKAIQLTEDLMRKGVPAAWDNMGAYYMGGVGPVKQDATVAWAFWQRAADMGSMAAQTYIGAKLFGADDHPPEWWANPPVGLQMLECAFAQGDAKAGHELGREYATRGQKDKSQKPQALRYFHEATKLGSEDAANALAVDFRQGSFTDETSVAETVDKWRSERYSILGDALYTNPDLRFPNLDKVLPLPPARLPTWDGKKESLINAAKAVVPVPPAPAKPAPNPASQRTGRAHIPEGFTLPERAQVEVPAQYETTAAPVGGYWIARLMRHADERHIAWDEAQVPTRYKKNELFDRSRVGLQPEDGRLQFHYLGDLVAVQSQPDVLYEHPMVARGIARYGDVPVDAPVCRGSKPCPQSGVWVGNIPEDHPMAAVFNQWHRQAYVERGQAFPDPKAQHLDIEARAVTWQWRAQVNDVRGGDWVYISVDELAASALLKPVAGEGSDGPVSA